MPRRQFTPIEIPEDAVLVPQDRSIIALWRNEYNGQRQVTAMRITNFGQDNQFVKAAGSLSAPAFTAAMELADGWLETVEFEDEEDNEVDDLDLIEEMPAVVEAPRATPRKAAVTAASKRPRRGRPASR